MLITFFLRQSSSNNHHHLADRNIKSSAMYSELITEINIFIDTCIYVCIQRVILCIQNDFGILINSASM